MRAKRPPWCGTCDEYSRLVDMPDGSAGRCPVCHPVILARHDQQAARARRRQRATRGTTRPDCPVCGARIYKSHRCTKSALRKDETWQ